MGKSIINLHIPEDDKKRLKKIAEITGISMTRLLIDGGLKEAETQLKLKKAVNQSLSYKNQ